MQPVIVALPMSGSRIVPTLFAALVAALRCEIDGTDTAHEAPCWGAPTGVCTVEVFLAIIWFVVRCVTVMQIDSNPRSDTGGIAFVGYRCAGSLADGYFSHFADSETASEAACRSCISVLFKSHHHFDRLVVLNDSRMSPGKVSSVLVQ